MLSEITIRICRRRIAAGLIPVLCVLTVFGVLVSCTQEEQRPSGAPEKITLAYSTPPYTVLVDIALKQGYFQQEGLNVTPKQFAYGKLAFDALLEGEADLATVGETPFMFAVMNGEQLSLIATIQTSNRNNGIVARKDRGILAAADLRGKRIGVTFGTVGEFFMDSFLISHGISRQQVRVVNLSPDQMQAALADGRVDAVSTWRPVLGHLQKQLGGTAAVFYDAEIYTQMFCVAGRPQFVREHPGRVRNLLRALLRAEEFAAQDPPGAQDIIAASSGIDPAAVAAMWTDNEFSVTLDQSLILALEDESRWAIKSKLVNSTKVPNYLNSIYADGLLSVRPKAVGLIR